MPWLAGVRGDVADQCLDRGDAELLAPVHKSSFSMSTYKTIFEENYEASVRFQALTHFTAEDNFYTALPSLLKSKR